VFDGIFDRASATLSLNQVLAEASRMSSRPHKRVALSLQKRFQLHKLNAARSIKRQTIFALLPPLGRLLSCIKSIVSVRLTSYDH
jgi:hypothetical protein